MVPTVIEDSKFFLVYLFVNFFENTIIMIMIIIVIFHWGGEGGLLAWLCSLLCV